MNTQAGKPSPHAQGLSQPYWEGAGRGKLMLQRCAACGKVRHYPQVVCAACYCDQHDWIESSGRGTVHSWTVAHHAFHPGFAGDLPYTLVTVDLDEGVRALGLLDGIAPKDVAIGRRVKASFPIGDDGFGRLMFVPA